MAILQRVRLGTHFLFTLMPGPSTLVQTCFGLSQIFFPDHILIYCNRPNYVMLTYAFQFTGKIPLFSFISTSTVITHLGRICCHIVIPVNAPKRAFMDNDNSEDLRLTEGGSFSSDIARAGEPEIINISVRLFHFPKMFL